MSKGGARHRARGTEQFILHDLYYLDCIRAALVSKGSLQNYGSILVKNDRIIGRGYNRLIQFRDKIRQGYANHAEINAINDALRQKRDTRGSTLYVAGFFPTERMLCLRSEPNYTCTRCIPGMEEYGVKLLAVPTLSGWETFPMDEVEGVVRNFRDHTPGKNTHEKRLSAWHNPYTIDFLLERVHSIDPFHSL